MAWWKKWRGRGTLQGVSRGHDAKDRNRRPEFEPRNLKGQTVRPLAASPLLNGGSFFNDDLAVLRSMAPCRHPFGCNLPAPMNLCRLVHSITLAACHCAVA